MNNQENKIELNEKQNLAAKHVEGPGLVLSVPGSGKTTILIKRILNLVEINKIDPSKILTITFSKSSASDMEKRFDIMNKNNYKTNFSTIHRLCYMIVKKYSLFSGKKYKLLESKEILKIDGQIITKSTIVRGIASNLKKEYIGDELCEDLISQISLYKNRCMDAELLSDIESRYPFFLSLYKGYEKFKAKHDLIDFDDMLTKAYDILVTYPSFLNKIKGLYTYIQVDEAQDTSEIQHKIISLLSGNNNIFMVADDDQTIYSFRGAYPDAILNFKSNFPKGQIYKIDTNYRSSDEILNLSNNIIMNNKNRYQKTLTGVNGNIEPVKYFIFDTLVELTEYLVDNIKNKENLSTAILYRNNLTMNYLIEFLDRNNIQYKSREKSSSLLNNPFVKDIWDFFQFAMTPTDFEVLNRIYFKFNSYISRNQMNSVKGIYGFNLIDSIISTNKLKDFQVKSFTAIRDFFEEICELRPLESLEIILKELGYEDYVFENIDRFPQGINYYNHTIDILRIVLQDTENIYDIKCELSKKISSNFRENCNLTISTIHSIKGMEFDCVYILDLFDGFFPRQSIISDFRALEEERRLLYVALTRSKTKLEILNTNFKNGHYLSPGIFQSELLNSSLLTPERISMQSKNCISISSGEYISHKKFGRGKIISINGDTLSIMFSNGMKKLSKSILIENELIEIK